MNLSALESLVVEPTPGAATDKVLIEYNEAAAVELALRIIPPLKTVGTDWYVYREGVWLPTPHHLFRPVALSVLDDSIKNNKRTVEMLKHIESLKQVPESDLKSFYLFNTDAVLLNAANGIVRVQHDYELVLTPHEAGFNFIRQLKAVYDPAARCPNFDRVLQEALPDANDRVLFQLFVGSLLYPSCKFEVALVCYGPGGTGKSTIAEAIASILGHELVQRIGMSNICDPKGYSLPKLKHVAVNLGTELDALEVGESGNFKALASGEPIEVRPIYGAPFTMSTTAKLWFLSNNMPRFKHGTDAEQRRMRFLRFDRVPAVRDVELKEKLVAERDGIFLWALEGLSRLLTMREMPLGGAESRRVHERFGVSNDPLGTFVASRCRMSPQGHVSKDHFRSALTGFCEENAITCVDDSWLFKQLWDRYPDLKEAQITQGTSRVRVIKGLLLV